MLRRSFWSPSGGGGSTPITLAGDVTGLSDANTVVTLTGSAGIVTAPTASIAFGTTPATATGYVRAPNNTVIAAARNQGNSADVAMMGLSTTNFAWFGSSPTATNQAQGAILNGSTSSSLVVNGSTKFQATSTLNASSVDVAIGTTPATAGALRMPNGVPGKIRYRDAGNTVDYTTVYVDTSNQSSFGGTPGVSAETTARTSVVATTQICMNVGAVSTTALSWNFNGSVFGPGESVTTPTIQQTTKTTDALPEVFLIKTQQPFASATGSNRKPGDLRFDLGTPTNGGSTPANVYMRWNSLDVIQYSFIGSGFGYIAFLRDQAGASGNLPTSTDAGYLRFPNNTSAMAWRNAANTADILGIGVSTTNVMYIGGDSIGNRTPAGIQITSSLETNIYTGTIKVFAASTSTHVTNYQQTYNWAETVSAPKLFQVAKTTNATPETLTISPQQPFASATGANNVPGSLRVDLGTNTNSYTTSYPSLFIKNQGTDFFTFGYDGGATPTPYLQIGTQTTTAGFGGVRMANQYRLVSRNQANTADIVLAVVDSGSNAIFGGYIGLNTVTASRSVVTALSEVRLSPGNASDYWGFTSTTFQVSEAVANPVMSMTNRTTDNATQTLTLQGQGAHTASTGTNRDGGVLMLQGGIRKAADTNGRRKGVQIRLDTTSACTMIEATDVQAEATAASRIISLLRTAAITTTQMPTNTGDLVVYIGNCATAPTANPVSGSILYVEAGATKVRGTGGTITTIAPA